MSRLIRSVALLALCGAMPALARPAPDDRSIYDIAGPPTYEGPDEVKVDLLRPGKEGPARTRIYVQATLPDGEKGLFLVDTGAAISVLSEETAERLKLPLQHDMGVAEGMGGRTTYDEAVIPELRLGEAVVKEVEVAVGVNGVPDHAGWMPLDGILGNNVWQQFTLEIDYPADLLVLHRPGTVKLPKRAAPMHFDGGHVYTPIEVTTATDPPRSGPIVVMIDTGASELTIGGPRALPFEIAYSEGIEPLLGIGAADTMPPHAFFQHTRRIPLDKVGLGGRQVDVDFEAQWINYTEDGPRVGPQNLPGLAGHELLAENTAWFDYQGGQFALSKSTHKKRVLDGHQVLLDQDVARYGDDASRYRFRAEMYTALEEWEKADTLLMGYLATNPEPKEAGKARVLLAAVRRLEGDLEGAWKALAPMSPAELVEQGEIVATVNGLLLDGRTEEALALSDAAIEGYSKEQVGEDDYDPFADAAAHTARSDVFLALERYGEANDELLQSARILDNPDAQLLRRARVALAEGDRYGAMAHVRRMLQLYPSNGQYLWFYATLVTASGPDADTFRADMTDAIGRLHQSDRPLDYMVMAHHLLGEQEQAETLMREGLERDCDALEEQANRENCYAWYYAMAGVEQDEALRLVDHALQLEGDRSDFLDTKAMVHLSRGELQKAHEAAMAAARLSPDEIYMLWQAERIGQIATEKSAAAAKP
jgi:tetratricopeptide (TPR) repeat protein